MTAFQELVAARERILDPRKWTQGRMHSRGGHCLIGSLYPYATTIPFDAHTNPAVQALDRLLPDYLHFGILRRARRVAFFNDGHTHAEVIALLDKAIEAERPLTVPVEWEKEAIPA